MIQMNNGKLMGSKARICYMNSSRQHSGFHHEPPTGGYQEKSLHLNINNCILYGMHMMCNLSASLHDF